MSAILVTIKPTFYADKDAVGRLLGAVCAKLGANYARVAIELIRVLPGTREACFAGRESTIRIGYDDGRVWAEVLP